MSNTVIKRKDFFENLFKMQDNPWHFSWRASQQYRYHSYLNMITPFFKEKNNTALDIGSALGDFTFLLYKKKFFLKIIGSDISDIACKKANKRFNSIKNLNFKQFGLPNIPFEKESLSFISMLEVINYIPQNEQILSIKNAHTCLEKNGLLFISVNLGKNYFEKKKIKKLILDQGFKIENEQYVQEKLYRKIERKPLQWYEQLKKTKYTDHTFTQFLIKILKRFLSSLTILKLAARCSKILQEEPVRAYIVARKVKNA